MRQLQVQITRGDNFSEQQFRTKRTKEVIEEDNTINATVQTSILAGKDINLFAEFDGDTFDGYLKIPFIGKIKFKDGRKIEE